jgi:succinyl-CoA synthetase beta subunit
VKIIKDWVDPAVGFMPYQARKVAAGLGLRGPLIAQAAKLIAGVYKTWWECDASMVEINPLGIVEQDGKEILTVVDAKIGLDDNALYRHPDFEAMRDLNEEDALEIESKKYNLNYIRLDGNVGCMVNGAGLAMATMDMIKLAGGEPANFLDVGGTANAQTVEAGFRIILGDENVKAILVNIFGGIVRCDRVAQGIVDAYKNLGSVNVPIIVRLQGTNAEEAKKIIDESGLKVYSATLLSEAADLVKKVINNNN